MYIKKIIPILFLAVLNAYSVFSQVNSISEFQSKVLNKFGAGVNLSLYENYWKKADAQLSEDILAKLETAHKIGFKTIRLPVDFDSYTDKKTNTIDIKLLQKLLVIYNYTNSKQMNLIITCHYGQLYKTVDFYKEASGIVYMWKQFVIFFKGKGYDNLFFGLYNEPRVPGEEWAFADEEMISKLRPSDRNRYWIVGSTDYNGIDAFTQLKLIKNDHKIIYTFHFYQPYIFTHQGASWDIEKTYITNLPYPYNVKEMPALPARAKGKVMEYNYNHYCDKGNKNFIIQKIRKIYEWSVLNQAPVICTEFGAINTISKKYRDNYITDVTDVMKEFGIPAMVWDLDQTFSITNNNIVPLKSINVWVKSFNNAFAIREKSKLIVANKQYGKQNDNIDCNVLQGFSVR